MLTKNAAIVSAMVLNLFAYIPQANATTAIFDFESSTPTFTTGGSRTGALTSLALADSGLMLTITRPGTAFDLVSNSSPGQDGKPAGWGNVSLDPFFDVNPSSFIFDFSTAIDSLSLEFGDYGGDDDTLFVDLYSGLGGTGTLLASVSTPYGTAGFPTAGTLTASSAGTLSAVVRGGSAAFPNSVFYDNVSATFDTRVAAVPESSSWAMLISGIGLVGMTMRRRRSVAVRFA